MDLFTVNPDGSGKVIHECTSQEVKLGIDSESTEDSLKEAIGKVITETKGVEVRSIGQDAQGGTFLALADGISAMGDRQFGIGAVGRDGRDLGGAGSYRGGQSDEQRQQLVERFYFQVSLTDIASFRIGTRPVRTMEWSNVVLPRN